MQAQERFIRTEMKQRVAEGERRAALKQALHVDRRRASLRTFLITVVHGLCL